MQFATGNEHQIRTRETELVRLGYVPTYILKPGQYRVFLKHEGDPFVPSYDLIWNPSG